MGLVVGREFILGVSIGAGGAGEVYEARHLTTGKLVAIKLLHRRLSGDPDFVRRFRREAASASLLRHPHSVLILGSEAGDLQGSPYIVMELLRGRTLSHVIRQESPMAISRVLRIMSQVLAAIGEAHLHGIVHRDLKPGNIMLVDREGTRDFVKVCDFGMAKAFNVDDETTSLDNSFLTGHGILCGTPEYMSPEQARAETLDGRADLYSAAVILYQMVTGALPFQATSPMGVLSRQITEPPRPPTLLRGDPDLTPELERLILRGLAKNREARPKSAEEFRAELERIRTLIVEGRVEARGLATHWLSLGSEPDSPATPGTLPGPELEATPRPVPRLPLGVVLLLLGLVASFAWFGGGRAMRASRAFTPHLGGFPSVSLQENRNESTSNPLSLTTGSQGSPRILPEPASESGGLHGPDSIRTYPDESVIDKIAARSEALMFQGRLAEACEGLEKARKQYPTVAAIYKLLGQCYMRSGQTALARVNYRRYLSRFRHAPDAVFISGMLN